MSSKDDCGIFGLFVLCPFGYGTFGIVPEEKGFIICVDGGNDD